MDVSGRGAAVYHAGGGFRERAFPSEVLLSGGLWDACAHRGRVRCSRLQELRDRQSVSYGWAVCCLSPLPLLRPTQVERCGVSWCGFSPTTFTKGTGQAT